jgi:uncharacterized protein
MENIVTKKEGDGMSIQGIGTNHTFTSVASIGKKNFTSIHNKQFEMLLNETLNDREDKGKIKINEMLDGIEKIREMLEKETTTENLNEFKSVVKDFLDYYTKNELYTQDYTLRDGRGFQKKITMVKTVDQKLNNLTEKLLESNFGHLEVLRRVGEIHGLLLDFYV